MSILSKLITVLVAIASITLVIIGALSYSNAKTTLQQTHLSNLEVIADLKLREIDTYFSAIHADIEIATNYFNVRSNLPVLAQYISDKTHPRYQTARACRYHAGRPARKNRLCLQRKAF